MNIYVGLENFLYSQLRLEAQSSICEVGFRYGEYLSKFRQNVFLCLSSLTSFVSLRPSYHPNVYAVFNRMLDPGIGIGEIRKEFRFETCVLKFMGLSFDSFTHIILKLHLLSRLSRGTKRCRMSL